QTAVLWIVNLVQESEYRTAIFASDRVHQLPGGRRAYHGDQFTHGIFRDLAAFADVQAQPFDDVVEGREITPADVGDQLCRAGCQRVTAAFGRGMQPARQGVACEWLALNEESALLRQSDQLALAVELA